MQNGLSRKHYTDMFRPLNKNSRAYARLILGLYVAAILLSIVIGQTFLEMGGIAAYCAVGLLMLFIGTRLRGLNNIIHECTHRSFAVERDDNVTFGRTAAALVFNTFEAYQKEHVSHHINRGNYELDLDFHHRKGFRIEEKLSPLVIARHILTPILGLHLYRYCRPNFSAADGRIYQLLKFAIVICALTFAVFNPLAAFLLVFLPYAWIYTAINYWTDCIDHGGILTESEEIDAARNFIVPKPLRLVLFPRNNCYHLLHHLYPSVPSQHFDHCHELLLLDPAYSEVHGRETRAACEMTG